MKQGDSKKSTIRSTLSKERGGISTGTVYVRVDKIDRLRRLLAFQQHEEPTEERLRSYTESLFAVSDHGVENVLAHEEFKAVTQAAFPRFLQEIEDLYRFALRIAKIRRNEVTLQPPSAVKTKLYEEIAELHEVIMQVEHGSHASNHLQRDQLDVRLRLASVLYYAVQNLKHDLVLAATSPANMTLDDAMSAFHVIVMNACSQAQCTLFVGFTSAVRKFGCRSLLEQKNEQAERLLVSTIDDAAVK